MSLVLQFSDVFIHYHVRVAEKPEIVVGGYSICILQFESRYT